MCTNQPDAGTDVSFAVYEQVSQALQAANSECVNPHLSPPSSWELWVEDLADAGSRAGSLRGLTQLSGASGGRRNPESLT